MPRRTGVMTCRLLGLMLQTIGRQVARRASRMSVNRATCSSRVPLEPPAAGGPRVAVRGLRASALPRHLADAELQPLAVDVVPERLHPARELGRIGPQVARRVALRVEPAVSTTVNKPNPAAAAAHERLFPGHVSTLAVTDPELIEYFDNFAFDEVLRHTGDLPERTRLMAQLAAMIAVGAVSEYRVMLGAALTVGVTLVEVKEIVYQAVPYVGPLRPR